MFRIPTNDNFRECRSPLGLLALLAVVLRLVAAAVLIIGPWTDDPSELAGWDVERFVEIAESSDQAWTETPVEYPPGSVVVFEAANLVGRGLSGSPTVGTHRALVIFMLMCDLASAAILHRRFGFRSSAVYLLVGLPLVPMGLLRLDVLTIFLALVAVTVSWPRCSPTKQGKTETRRPSTVAVAVAGGAAAAGAAIKLWPLFMMVPLWVLGRRRTALVTGGIGAVLVGLWLGWSGIGVDPINQVLSLRGASGWHVESTGGLLTTLGDVIAGQPADPVLELNAYRTGTISTATTTVGRVAALAVLLSLAWQARAATRRSDLDPAVGLAAVMAGTISVLLATAPLLSPQFVLWLTPWAAILAATPKLRWAHPSWLIAGTCLITGVTLAVFSPSGVTDPVASSLLLARNLTMLVLPVACWLWLGSLRTELPDERSGPRLELPDTNVDEMTSESRSL